MSQFRVPLRLIWVTLHPMLHETGVFIMVRVGVLLILFLNSLAAAGTQFSGAEEMYNRAQYRAVIEDLKPFEAQPEALRLTGRSFFMLGDFRKAVQYFQRLVKINPLNSIDFQWLGKAWARRADTSSPVRAPGYNVNARKSFERAVELDPSSVSTLKELLELYLDRRGLEKAQAIATRIGELDAAEGVRAQERILFRRQELATPEEKVRMAIDQVSNQVSRAIDLSRPAN
jgi:tetratricopeptide (TPR) repeat protein